MLLPFCLKMSVFSVDTDEETASDNDWASGCDAAKDIVKRFLQEESECEDNDISVSEKTPKNRLHENSQGLFSEDSKAKCVSKSSFNCHALPISANRNYTDDESNASCSYLTVQDTGKLSYRKLNVVSKNNCSNNKKRTRTSFESDCCEKTSVNSESKKYFEENTKEGQINKDSPRKKTKSSHSAKIVGAIILLKRCDSDLSKWNVGSCSKYNVRDVKRYDSDDTLRNNEHFSNHSHDIFMVRNSVSSYKQHGLDYDCDEQFCCDKKSQHIDWNSHSSEKSYDTDIKNGKLTDDILKITRRQLNRNKNEFYSQRKSLFTESKKSERLAVLNQSKQRSFNVSSASSKRPSLYSCSADVFSLAIQNSQSSESAIGNRCSMSSVFANVESEVQNDLKLWANSSVNLINCDHLVKKYSKSRKLDD